MIIFPKWKLIDLASREEFRTESMSLAEARKRNKEYEDIGSTLDWIPAPEGMNEDDQDNLLRDLLGVA